MPLARGAWCLEIGMGTDIPVATRPRPACRALRDALWHNSLSSRRAWSPPPPTGCDIVDVHIGVPRPRMVDKAQVWPFGLTAKDTVSVTEGGLESPTMPHRLHLIAHAVSASAVDMRLNEAAGQDTAYSDLVTATTFMLRLTQAGARRAGRPASPLAFRFIVR